MKFVNRTGNKLVGEATVIATDLLSVESLLMREVKEKNDWRWDGQPSGAFVFKHLTNVRTPLPVEIYTSKNPFSSAIGYYANGVTHLNSRKMHLLSLNDLTANLLHEYAHYCGFSHGDNYQTTEKNLYSVPYFLSTNAHKFTGLKQETETICYKPWYYFGLKTVCYEKEIESV